MTSTSSVIATLFTDAREFLHKEYERNQITLDVARYIG